MDEKIETVNGVSLAQWAASFRPGMQEFAAAVATFTREGDLVRIAFGNSGPFINVNGDREPVFTHAVTLPPSLAVEIARLLLKSYAQPSHVTDVASKEL